MSRCCVAKLTHMLQTSSSNQTHVLVASNNISLSRQEGRMYIITLLNSLPVSVFYSITSSRCVEDTPGYTLVHTLGVHDKYSPACWVSRKLRPKSKLTIVCYTADCFKSFCLQFVDTMSKVNVTTL